MKKILLLSDSHSHIDDRILHYASLVDEVWHAGDIGSIEVTDALKKIKPLRAVYGNIDGGEIRKEFEADLIFSCEQTKVWITHIGGYPGKYPARIKERFKDIKPDIFICGHSHILKVQYDKVHSLLHMNPGAAGKSGFHQVRTMLTFSIDAKQIKDVAVIELGIRG
jgi:uncharacterized protein